MAKQFAELPRSGQLYVITVIGLGLSVVGYSVSSLVLNETPWNWLVLAALTLVTGSFSIKVPSVNARLSVSEAFVFAALLAFGQNVATVIVALDSVVLTSWLRKPSRSPFRVMFNMAAGALAISVTGYVLSWMVPVQPPALAPLDQLLLPVALLAVSYFLINSWLIAVAVGFEQKQSAAEIWLQNFLWFGLNYLGGASVALVLVNFTRNLNLAAVGVIVPLVVILYITFRTSWARVEDANRHVVQVNDLYMSTIEALAMAVDAKDQITHGHIRRVQVFALELAKRLGVTDESQLKAIATAALLHDMGKLAIPEHILNKPGQLTSAEFEKMKRHADIGADLLSSVKFPYPVVPIVRHHHEHWDGTGYPASISGTDIPLGARILSVVDCFDALTSDRPYRPRLSIDDAFTIIRERRGTSYDPLVVDTFVAAYHEIAPVAMKAAQEARSVVDTASFATIREADTLRPLRQIRANASETALLAASARDIAKAASLAVALQATANGLRQLTPATVYA
ncbi:MAG: HD domain-containing protein [Acidobacteria bacterium]|nr:HD domain-containing protein [Acidobacteriota bacterium]